MIGGLASLAVFAACTPASPADFTGAAEGPSAQLGIAEFRDRLEGGWVMQMAGYAWSAPTEYKFMGSIMPESAVPTWMPESLNSAFGDDNFYSQGPYFTALIDEGPFVTLESFGERFARLEGQLWHANAASRENLLAGFDPPESGHYLMNPHAQDIDWLCCGSGFIGLVTPAQPKAALDLAFRAGHVVSYGDGIYPGVVASVMISSAYVASSPEEIVHAGLAAAPVGSRTRAILDDVLASHARQPDDWTKTWQRLHDVWEQGEDRGRCPDEVTTPAFAIDSPLHLAYDVMALLYGGGDIEVSMEIAMRAGQDSDCTTHTVGQILGTWLGLSALDDKWTSKLDRRTKLAGTELSYDQVIERSVDAARAIVRARGGQVTAAGTREETWLLPVEVIAPPLLERWPREPNAVPEVEVAAMEHGAREVSFLATVQDDDGIGEVEWYFGDFSSAKGDRVTHRYLARGRYEVLAFVSDATGNATARRIFVTVK